MPDVYTRDHCTVVQHMDSNACKTRRLTRTRLRTQQSQRHWPGPSEPFRLAVNVGARIMSHIPLLHWLDSTDRAIGCGWKPTGRSKVQLILTDADWQDKPSVLLKCTYCFKHKPLPEQWILELNERDESCMSAHLHQNPRCDKHCPQGLSRASRLTCIRISTRLKARPHGPQGLSRASRLPLQQHRLYDRANASWRKSM
eukprot:6468272-Amphidinium_carterae.1